MILVEYLDRRQIVKEEDPRHVLPLLYLSPLEVLCDRVLVAVDGVVPYILVYGWHHLQCAQLQLGSGTFYRCLSCLSL